MKLHGWINAEGPVWRHQSGVIAHIMGTCLTTDGETHRASTWPESKRFNYWVRRAGSRKRAVLAWAMEKEEECQTSGAPGSG